MSTTAPPPQTLNAAPTGGTLVPGGATFRIWAPRAKAVYVTGEFTGWAHPPQARMQPIGGGHWASFVPGLKDGDEYLFYIEGPGRDHFKRDPRARALTREPDFPLANCVLRDPSRFPWHPVSFRTPAFSDLIVYELHVGTFSIAPGNRYGTFLDVIERIPYLATLGVNAIELLPIQEFETMFSLGYNGVDYYSPENQYGEWDEQKLQTRFTNINAILQAAGQPAYPDIQALRGSDNQLRALVDVCHVYGIGVILDVVYNHAGGGFDGNSMWFLDCMPDGNLNDSLYFTDQGFAGGQVFAYWNDDVRQFIIDNTRLFLEEYRVDGFRYDEVSTMDRFGGWKTCQDMTATLKFEKPEAIQIAEYWPVNNAIVGEVSHGGAGFDATWSDGLRLAIRAALGAAATGAASKVSMEAIANALWSAPVGGNRWRAVQSIEDHDRVYDGRDPRIAALADSSNSRSWYARSRSRVATGLLLTAPGIPMLFMGQEILEGKQWSDNPDPSHLIDWAGLDGDKQMGNFLRFTQDLIALRRRMPAMRGEGFAVVHTNDDNRVLAFQRWVEEAGQDIMVIFSLSERTWYNYQIGFPGGGRWLEIFNSDVYDDWLNPRASGNKGAIQADGPAMHGLSNSAGVVIPANGFVVFTRG